MPDHWSNTPLQAVEAHYALGTKVVWSGITSTSRSLARALDFARGGGVVFRIRRAPRQPPPSQPPHATPAHPTYPAPPRPAPPVLPRPTPPHPTTPMPPRPIQPTQGWVGWMGVGGGTGSGRVGRQRPYGRAARALRPAQHVARRRR